MPMNRMRHCNVGISIMLATRILLLLSFVLFNYGYVYAVNNTVNNTNNTLKIFGFNINHIPIVLDSNC